MAVAVVVLVVLGMMVAGGLLVASRQARIGTGESQAVAAFYAAESGLSAALAAWDTGFASSLRPGTARCVTAGDLAAGARYDVRLTRLDDDLRPNQGLYLLTSTGWALGAHRGRRQLSLLLRPPDPERWCCGAALTTAGDVYLEDDGVIRGLDDTPAVWDAMPGMCEEHPVERAGILAGPANEVRRQTGAVLEGEPPLLRLDGGMGSLLGEIETAIRELSTRSDINLPAGTRLDNIGASLDTDGSCAAGQPENWGEPLLPGHPCFTHTPIIFANGDLTIAADGRGQGVLLVEGDLDIQGDFNFYGPIIVRGDLSIRAGAVHGSVLAPFGSAISVFGDGRLRFLECAVFRAFRSAKLVLPHPLAQFSWLEILE